PPPAQPTATAVPSRQTHSPNPLSQSFSRSYGSILPTSLIYIVLSTRGYSPWRPAAVIGTTEREVMVAPPYFQGPSQAHRTPAMGCYVLGLVPYLQTI